VSLDTRGTENDLRTPNSSRRLSMVAALNSSRNLRLGVAVIGMEDQRLLASFTDPLTQAGPTLQIGCDGWILTLPNIPGHHFATPHVDHEVEVKPDSADPWKEIGDVPAPHLIRS
jgi:hypothetical protein